MKTPKVLLYGNPIGGYGDKFNRIAKLHSMKDYLLRKMDDFQKAGAVTHRTKCALAVKMMMLTGIRIGNESSAEGYVSKRSDAMGRTIQTYGLTTLNKKHFTFRNGLCYVTFVGKREVKQTYKIGDAKLIAQIKRVMGATTDSETMLGLSDYELRKFIAKSVGNKFCAKDFRTLYANVMASDIHARICKEPLPNTKTEANAEIKTICEYVAEQLGNTPGVCKRSYIDSGLIDYHLELRYFKPKQK